MLLAPRATVAYVDPFVFSSLYNLGNTINIPSFLSNLLFFPRCKDNSVRLLNKNNKNKNSRTRNITQMKVLQSQHLSLSGEDRHLLSRSTRGESCHKMMIMMTSDRCTLWSTHKVQRPCHDNFVQTGWWKLQARCVRHR
jgi:hypothetical protein